MSSDFAQLLPIYYKRLFPHKLMFDWLSKDARSPNGYFSFREFSFTLKDDIYIRYLSFETPDELRRELCRRLPYKIDIGAYYSLKPKNHKLAPPGGFRALEKELVFDIDMTDYDDVRYCCSEANVCIKCWRLMTIAIRFLDDRLRNDFGFRHLLWVFSGRRGIHCWICDDDVKLFDQSVRSALCDYLSIPKAIDKVGKRNTFASQPPPLIYKAISLIERVFPRFIEEQKIFKEKKQIEDFLKLLPEDLNLRNLVSTIIDDPKNEKKWDAIRKELGEYKVNGSGKLDWEIMLHYCYPRLDVNVSTAVNHLLKSPFCAHPKTSNICVPIDVDKLDSFDPFGVPNLIKLNEELNSFCGQTFKENETPMDVEAKEEDLAKPKLEEYKLTSLKKYVDFFSQFIKRLSDERSNAIAGQDMKMEF